MINELELSLVISASITAVQPDPCGAVSGAIGKKLIGIGAKTRLIRL